MHKTFHESLLNTVQRRSNYCITICSSHRRSRSAATHTAGSSVIGPNRIIVTTDKPVPPATINRRHWGTTATTSVSAIRFITSLTAVYHCPTVAVVAGVTEGYNYIKNHNCKSTTLSLARGQRGLYTTTNDSCSIRDNDNHTKNNFIMKRDCSIMTEESAVVDIDLWNGKDTERYCSLDHPGYSMQSHPDTYLGGWLAHRAALQVITKSTTNDENGHGDTIDPDWIQTDVAPYISKFDYMSMPIGRAPRILVLYGSLRAASYSRKMAYEFARLLELVGCDVRVYNPMGLPVRNPDEDGEQHVKVVEIRALTHWSDGHVWVSPEMHGTITGIFKNQIDWMPLNTGSVRPTQGKTCCVAQVNGGSQSFNAVNALRLLARWMRMPCCTNQSSVAKAWQEFDDSIGGGRMKPSDFRNRVVDVVEEFAKFTAVMVPVADQLTDRYSERMEIQQKGRLQSQAEKELQKTIDEARKA